MSRRRRPKLPGNAGPLPPRAAAALRIIGGRLRGSKLRWSGDPRTRPMKDRVREAIFNLLGPAVEGKHVVDLFAGTGALALEALSRGAAGATLIERHYPTAGVIRGNVAALGLDDQCEVVTADTFIWARRRVPLPPAAWLVFSSPPYCFYEERRRDMLDLLEGVHDRAPRGSLLVVEADGRFDFCQLPHGSDWDVRAYPPAVVGVYELPSARGETRTPTPCGTGS